MFMLRFMLEIHNTSSIQAILLTNLWEIPNLFIWEHCIRLSYYNHLHYFIDLYLIVTTKWTYSYWLGLKCSYCTFSRVLGPEKKKAVACKYWSLVHPHACKWIWYRKGEHNFEPLGINLVSFFCIYWKIPNDSLRLDRNPF